MIIKTIKTDFYHLGDVFNQLGIENVDFIVPEIYKNEVLFVIFYKEKCK